MAIKQKRSNDLTLAMFVVAAFLLAASYLIFLSQSFITYSAPQVLSAGSPK